MYPGSVEELILISSLSADSGFEAGVLGGEVYSETDMKKLSTGKNDLLG